MALKILIASPHKKWAKSTSEFLEQQKYEVDIAFTGRDAQLQVYNNKIFVVLLSLDLQNHSGLQVLNFIKTQHASQKVLVMCNLLTDHFEDEELALKDFARLGIHEVLIGEVSNEDLLKRIEGEQSFEQFLTNIEKRDSASDEEEVTAKDEEFTAIKIDEFYAGQTALFDIFVKLGNEKYVKILHSGDKFEAERLRKYRDEKKVEYLFFMKKDRKKYIQYTKHLLGGLLENQKGNTELKLELSKNLTEKFVEEIYTEGVRPQLLEQSREIAEETYKLISREKKLYKLMREFQDFDPSAYSHAFLVGLFSNLIIKQYDWQSSSTTQAVCLAAMTHDIGKLKLSEAIIKKRPSEMDESELEEYKKHPILSLEILGESPLIRPAVKQIIQQHHEYCDGSGFPSGLRKPQIFTMAKIVCLANDFSHTITEKKQTPVECLKEMLKSESSVAKYSSQVLDRFTRVFIDPEIVKKMDD